MFTSIKYIVRRFLSNKFFTLTNLTGLTIGLAVFIILISYVLIAFRYDHHHKQADRTYKLISRLTSHQGEVESFGISLGSIAEQLPQQYPFVEKSSLLYTLGEVNIEVKQQRFKQFEAAYVDYFFLDIFDFEGYRGQFKAPHQVVLSRQAAMRIFPGINPLGQTLTYQDKKFEVVEIIDVSPSTRFQFDILLPLEALADGEELIQGGFEFEVFAVLAASQNNNASLKVLANYYDQLVERAFNEYQSSSYWIPLKEVYFHEVHNRMGNGSKPLLWLVTAIAVIILLLALINYFNLQIASDHTRQTEIRIRRIMGARKKDLIYQSLLTSMLQVVISGVLALVLVILFYKIEGKQLFGVALLSLTDWPLLYWCIYISFLLALGALAGLAPALQLFKIGYSHQSSLKGLKLGKATIGLVVGQFFVTACLLSAVFLIQAQMRLIQEQPKGFNDAQVVVIRSLGEDFIQVYATLKNTLLAHPTIQTVAGAQGEPGGGVSGQSIRKLGDPIENSISINHIRAIDGYLNTFGLQLVKGDGFGADPSRLLAEGKTAFVLNETAYRKLFEKEEDPIGAVLEMGDRKGEVVGVVKDFHFTSMHSQVEPLVINIETPYELVLAIKLNTAEAEETLQYIAQTLQQIDPLYTLDYYFLDQQFNYLYKAELRTEKIITYATFVAFIISLLGLLALTSFTIQARVKEVAIRKVLGAELVHLLWLLTCRVFIWVLLGNLLAIPLIYFLGDYWTSGFIYALNLTNLFWIIPLETGITLIVALMVIAQQLWRTIRIDPVVYLRYE